MTSLIERIEAAVQPCSQLDREAFDILANGRFWPEYAQYWEYRGWSERVPIAFTASIDAAMISVPQGLYPTIDFVTKRCWLRDENGVDCFPQGRGFAATVPNAILAASLRALGVE